MTRAEIEGMLADMTMFGDLAKDARPCDCDHSCVHDEAYSALAAFTDIAAAIAPTLARQLLAVMEENERLQVKAELITKMEIQANARTEAAEAARDRLLLTVELIKAEAVSRGPDDAALEAIIFLANHALQGETNDGS